MTEHAAKIKVGQKEIGYGAAQVEHVELLLSAISTAEEASALSDGNGPVIIELGDCTVTVDFDR